jgi:hypothetical protein
MPERRYRRGNVVRFRMGLRMVEGIVTEDRGPIGMNGRHLYLIEFPGDRLSGEISKVELPAVDMELVKESVSMG